MENEPFINGCNSLRLSFQFLLRQITTEEAKLVLELDLLFLP